MPDSAKLRVRLTPRGGRNAVTGFENGVLHARVAAPPVDGAANKALIELLSEWLAIPKSRITIESGEHGREKTLSIAGIEDKQLRCLIDSLAAKLQAQR